MEIELEEEATGWRAFPWATLTLALAMLVVFVLSDRAWPDTSFERWGLLPSELDPRTLLSHPVFHVNGLQLLGSLLLLLVVGPPLEERFRAPVFGLLVVTGAVAGGAFYAWMTPTSTFPMVGAAGALACVAAACAFRFRSDGVRLAIYRPQAGGVGALRLTIPAWGLVPVWFACEVLGSMGAFVGATRGVASWAQLGGAAVGLGWAYAMERFGIESRWLGAPVDPSELGPHPAIEEAMKAREQGHGRYAVELLEKAVRDQPEDDALVVAFWEMASLAGEAPRAARPLRRLIQAELADGRSESAALHWCELTQRVADVRAGPRFLVQIATQLVEMNRPRDAGRALRTAAGSDGSDLSPGMALRIAELAGEIHPPTAILAAKRVLATDGLDDGKRERLERLVQTLEGREASVDLDADPAESVPDRSIEIEDDDLYAPPPLVDPDTEPMSVPAGAAALSADGALVSSDRAGDLSGGELVDAIEPQPSEPVLGDLQRRAPGIGTNALVDETPSDVSLGLGVNAQDFSLEDDLDLHDAACGPDETPSTAVELGPASSVPDASASTVHAIGLGVAALTPRFVEAKIVDAIPTSLGADRIELQQPGGRIGHVDFARIDAVAVAAIRGLSSKPVVVMDLLANWTSVESEVLRVIRLRADRFDPRKLVSDAGDAADAFRSFAEIVLEQTGAVPLPDADAARGRPFQVSEDLNAYEREVLQLDR
jgi:membrane associated rhomboid family serine protease